MSGTLRQRYAPPLKQDELRQLAESRKQDALLLYDNQRYDSSYYLAGYALELLLKAHLCRQFSALEIPHRKWVQDIHTHDFGLLVKYAGLSAVYEQRCVADARFDTYARTISSWTPESRYYPVTELDCSSMIEACFHGQNGIYQWLFVQ